MSAAPGTEALVLEPVQVGSDSLTVRHSRPVRPLPLPVLRPEPPTEVSELAGAAAWAQALRLRSLPTVLLGAAVTMLLALAEPAAGVTAGVVAVVGLVVLHLLTALLRSLGDPRRHRAGPLRRVEAGRAVVGLVGLGAVLTGALVALIGWAAVPVVVGGLLATGLAVRAASSGRTAGVVAPFGCAVAAVAVWFTATGALPWRVVLAAATAGMLVACLRAEAPSRVLLAAPCAAVGLAVMLHALPWPALLVAVALPAARRAALTERSAAAPARLTVLLLLAGLAVAVGTGTDLPITAAR
jgi:hypothetical protein